MMKRRRILHTIILCWMLQLDVFITRTRATESSSKETDQLMEFLLQRVWTRATLKHNFVVAPFAMLELYRDLYSTGVSESSGAEQSNDILLTEPQTEPITVSNILHMSQFESMAKYSKRLKNLTLMRHTRTPQEAQSAIASQTELENNVTIKARWTQNFQKRDTHKHMFYHTAYDHVYTDFMRKDDVFRYADLKEYNATALYLGLQGDHMGVLFLRPYNVEGTVMLQKTICGNLSLIREIVDRRLETKVVRAIIPTFEMSNLSELHKVFEEFRVSQGMEDNLVGAEPDFDRIVHNCHIEVSENGIGEPEHTTVLFWNTFSSLRVTPEVFDLNQPFLFVVHSPRDILLMGHIVKL